MDRAFLVGRITATQTLIVAYEEALTALITGGVQSYTLHTGQDRQTVTKLDVEWLNGQLASLYARCSTLEARLNGGGVYLRPGW